MASYYPYVKVALRVISLSNKYYAIVANYRKSADLCIWIVLYIFAPSKMILHTYRFWMYVFPIPLHEEAGLN
ncbi:MAG: hypothetical protein MJZ69_01575 [Bacteroidaceae bacterium]|nr:hypothetical protein [Bacteroidaceae bacterium]